MKVSELNLEASQQKLSRLSIHGERNIALPELVQYT